MIRLPITDYLMLQEMGIDPVQFSRALNTNEKPRLAIASSDIAKIAEIDLTEAQSEYKTRAGLTSEDAKSVKRFAQVLEERTRALPDGDQIMDASLAAGFDAYELQLFARGLGIRGEEASLISAMFTTSTVALFPEYILRTMGKAPIRGIGYATLQDMIAGTEIVNGAISKGLKMTDTSGPKRFIKAEYADMGHSEIAVSEVTVYVQNLAHEFRISYEASRRASMNLLTLFIERSGEQFQKDLALWGANVIYGDDSILDGGDTATKDKITPKEIFNFKSDHEDTGYNPNLFLMTPIFYKAVGENSVFWDIQSGLNRTLLQDGALPPFMGMRPKKIVYDETDSDYGNDYGIMVDTAINMYQLIEAGSELAEVDNDVSGQYFKYPFSIQMGLYILMGAAAQKIHLKD